MTWTTISMAGILAFVVCMAAAWIWRETRDPASAFNFSDLMRDAGGRVSLFKFGQFAALTLSSWEFVHLALSNALTEWYYTTYMGAWALANVASKLIDRKNEP